MNKIAALRLSQHSVTYAQIRDGAFPETISAYEQATLLFCRQWLTGQTTFAMPTSGSTGTPKTSTVTRDQMMRSARMTGEALALQSGHAALVGLPTSYISGRMMLVRGFVLDLFLTIVEPSARPLEMFPADTQFDFLSFVPLQLAATFRETPDKLPILDRAKAILVGGAPVDAELEMCVQSVPAPVYQTYGMTETLSHVALRRMNGPDARDYYTVLNGVTLATDERDCLVIYSPVLNGAPVYTNDVVEILSPRTFRWVGRVDNVINSGGVKVHPEKVEQAVDAAFRALSIHRPFFVHGAPHPELGEMVTLFVEGTPLSPPQEETLWQQLRGSPLLTRYEVPRSIRYVHAFIRTPTAKIDRRRTVQEATLPPADQ